MIEICNEGIRKLLTFVGKFLFSSNGITMWSGSVIFPYSSIGLEPYAIRNKNLENAGSSKARMFSVNSSLLISFHKGEFTNLTWTWTSLAALSTTGNVCLKSPPNTTTFLPNGCSDSITSHSKWSNASIASRLTIVASSHSMSLDCWINFAVLLCLLSWQVFEAVRLRWILNLEWVVRSPGSIDATIPDVAIASAINACDLRVASRDHYKKVLLVPPGSFVKNAWLLSE